MRKDWDKEGFIYKEEIPTNYYKMMEREEEKMSRRHQRRRTKFRCDEKMIPCIEIYRVEFPSIPCLSSNCETQQDQTVSKR